MKISCGKEVYSIRRWLLIGVYMAGVCLLLWRAFDLQILKNEFLQGHGDARSVRVVEISAHRGMITDRNGESLAISTPVNSIWATPRKVLMPGVDFRPLTLLLDMEMGELHQLLEDRFGREFVYLKRQIDPSLAEKIMALNIPGISVQQEFRRYYPSGEVSSHLIGFTNIDDVGQEGLELAYDHWLRGEPGSKRVLKDRLGRIVENIESIKTPKPGKTLQLSIDRRIQYLAYRELKSAVNNHKARAGSLLMLDVKTGEVMAMVGQPAYNPNNRSGLKSEYYRNRIVTDVFEPGSTLKPFTIATALESGIYSLATKIDTRPGFVKVGDHLIRDINNYGVIDLATVIKKSSNVGASKIALSLEPENLWGMLSRMGLGQISGSGFPGEAGGRLTQPGIWSDVELATIAFGYGVSVTLLQLAQAYSVIAADGMKLPIVFHKVTGPVAGTQVLSTEIAQQVRLMLEAVVESGGTGQKAAIDGYRIAGKTGTVHKTESGGYSENRYISLFAGMAPASHPRLVMIVMIDEPQGGQHFGGQVAAPVFSRVMSGALRMLNIPGDNLPLYPEPIVAGTVKSLESIK